MNRLSAVPRSHPYTLQVSNIPFSAQAHDQGAERQRSTSASGLEAAARPLAPPADRGRNQSNDRGSGGAGPGRIRSAREAKLSPVEVAVLELVAEGMTNSEIATTLSKSSATVKAQVSSILRKLGARNRSAAVALWVRRGRGRK